MASYIWQALVAGPDNREGDPILGAQMQGSMVAAVPSVGTRSECVSRP